MKSFLLPVIVSGYLIGCAATSPELVGNTRAPVPASEVKIYSQLPAAYEQIANLNASSKSLFRAGGEKSTDKVIERLKEQAGKLGANGLVLQGFTDQQSASLGTGVGSGSASRSSAVGVGVGGSLGLFKKTGRAAAIFVPPG